MTVDKYALVKILLRMRLSKRIIRRLRGPYSQFEMANLMGIGSRHIHEWENLLVKPRAATIRRLVDHFYMWTSKYKIDPLMALSLRNKDLMDLERKVKEHGDERRM